MNNHYDAEEPKPISSKFRINFFFFVSFVIFSVIIIRLAYMQFVEGPELSRLQSESVTRTSPLLPVRGSIYDSSGKIKLAYSEPIQSLYITLYKNYSQQEGGLKIPIVRKLVNLQKNCMKYFRNLKIQGVKSSR